MRDKVIVIGGGVAGLTAAHELIERGFDVRLFERRKMFGGKAASVRVKDDSGVAPPVPGEHGFRFFPGWYRHLPKTLEEIPYKGGRDLYQGGTVLDNLVAVHKNLLTWFDRSPVELPLRVPRSIGDVGVAGTFVQEIFRLGLNAQEITAFFGKLQDYVTMSEAQRRQKLEPITWWAFLECDKRSGAFQDLARATTRTMVAAKAEEASAYTIGALAVRTLSDVFSTVDRVLNGPTSDVWIDPWVAHLKGRGVEFHAGYELDSIEFDRERPEIHGVVMQSVWLGTVRRARRLLQSIPWLCAMVGDVDDPEAKRRGSKELVEVADALVAALEEIDDPPDDPLLKLRDEFIDEVRKQANQVKVLCEELSARARPLMELELAQLTRLAEMLRDIEGEGAERRRVETAEYFVFALPLEQMAYYVNRSAALQHLDPSLSRIIRLATHLDWMAGIQFYLRESCDLGSGHVVSLDSPWALTALEQTQFWRASDLPRGTVPEDVRAIVSVDIAAWDRKGRFIHKEAFNCTKDEIAAEVWAQLKAMLSRGQTSSPLRDEMLRGGTALQSGVNFHVDDGIVDQRDPKKQAAYERVRGLRLSTDEVDRDQDGEPEQSAPYVWGSSLELNVEPLLVNRAGSRALRPEARTQIHNMFLAADYVLTNTDLACMEGANEAARRAVNGILDVARSSRERCKLWDFSMSRRVAEAATDASGLGNAVALLNGARAAATEFRDGMWRKVALGLMSAQAWPALRAAPGNDDDGQGRR
jgi:uncharacterized protein with NAD-binding domain and iron-sulfur cluster